MPIDDYACRECGQEFDEPEQVRRHQRKHGHTFEQYMLKWTYGGVLPNCACGCGGYPSWNVALKDYAKFVHGHHAVGHEVSVETRRKIGEKNAVTAKQFADAHPDHVAAKIALMNAGHTPDANAKRSASVHRFWSSSPQAPQRRREASDRAITLLAQDKIGPRAPFKTEWKHNPFTGNEERMHSSWETAFLDRCISAGYPVTKVHDLRVPYVSHDGTQHQYVPDFVALDDSVVFEVKGLMREDDDRKLTALQAWADANGHEVVLVDYLPA